jgi:hypothetical protein
MTTRFGENDRHQSFESMTRMLEKAELTGLFAPTEIPVIGDRVCIGSDLLKARKDITKFSASYAVTLEDDEVRVFVGDFLLDEEQSLPLRLGLTRGKGLDMQDPITTDLNDGYIVTMNPEGKRLFSMRGDESDDLTDVVKGVSFEPAELFAGACVYALHNILTREQAPLRFVGR